MHIKRVHGNEQWLMQSFALLFNQNAKNHAKDSNMSAGGKGSSPRPFSVDKNTFNANWDNIFRKETMQVRVQEDESKIGSCGCGRSPIGKCIGWHGLSEEAFQDRKEKYETGQVDLSGKEV
jgi:hypothetical protein